VPQARLLNNLVVMNMPQKEGANQNGWSSARRNFAPGPRVLFDFLRAVQHDNLDIVSVCILEIGMIFRQVNIVFRLVSHIRMKLSSELHANSISGPSARRDQTISNEHRINTSSGCAERLEFDAIANTASCSLPGEKKKDKKRKYDCCHRRCMLRDSNQALPFDR
jgi:hypothetical protein